MEHSLVKKEKSTLTNMGNQELIIESINIHRTYEEKLNTTMSELDNLKEHLELLRDEMKEVKKQKTRNLTEEEIYPVFESFVNNSVNSRNSTMVKRIVQRFEKKYKRDEELEWDCFTMMMQNSPVSLEWFVGCISVASQLMLGIFLILEQTERDVFCVSTLTVPVKSGLKMYIAQFIAIILSVMTQTDLVMGIRNMSLLWFTEENNWKPVVYASSRECKEKMMIWILRIFIPCLLKMIIGLIVLVATFFVIIQSESVVELLKDLAALLIVSTIDDVLFMLADNGYLGLILSNSATQAKGMSMKKKENKGNGNMKILSFVITTFLLAWIHLVIGQHDGRYMKQAYPLCPLKKEINGKTFQFLMANNECEFTKGVGPNIKECGWEGEDCNAFNGKYPNCKVQDLTRLGDGKCDSDVYNVPECGFDHGDCVKENLVNKLIVTEESENDSVDCIPSINSIPFNYTSDDWAALVPAAKYLIAIPKNSNYILKIDTITRSETLIGRNLGSDRRKWSYGLISNGIIFGIPWEANSILRFDHLSEQSSFIAKNHKLLMNKSFHGGVVAPNGMIYMFPGKKSKIVRFDSLNKTHPLKEIGEKLDKFYFDGTLGGDGNIYALPRGKPGRVLKINVTDDSTTFLGNNSCSVSSQGTLARDGNIYAISGTDGRIISINVEDQSTSVVDTKLRNIFAHRHNRKWDGFVEGADGYLYSIPCFGETILRFDPVSMNTTDIPMSNIRDTDKPGWTGSVRANNGLIYALPNHNFGPILEIKL